MDKKTWTEFHGFSYDDVNIMEGTMIVYSGTITDIFPYPWVEWLKKHQERKVKYTLTKVQGL